MRIISYVAYIVVVVALITLLVTLKGNWQKEYDALEADYKALSEALDESMESEIRTQEALSAALDRADRLIVEAAQVAAIGVVSWLTSPDEIENIISLIPKGNPFRAPWEVTSRFGSDSGFGGSRRQGHQGLDAVPVGNDWAIMGFATGVVMEIGIGEIEGKFVTIQHSERVRFKFWHLEKIYYAAVPGEEVTEETVIGIMGSTGYSDNPHLHFAIEVFDGETWIPIDPYPFMTGENK